MVVCVCTVYVCVCVSLYQCSSIGVQKNTCNYKITKSIIFFSKLVECNKFFISCGKSNFFCNFPFFQNFYFELES